MKVDIKRRTLLNRLADSIQIRNPSLVRCLQPGLLPETIVSLLSSLEIRADFQAMIDMFSWKNGISPCFKGNRTEASPFPESIYVFYELPLMIHHYREFRETFVFHPLFEDLRGRHFPLFWDGSTGYIALDLFSKSNAIFLLEPESDVLAREAYDSLDAFLEDAIRANQENDALKCFW